MEEQPGERLVNTLEHDLSEASGTPRWTIGKCLKECLKEHIGLPRSDNRCFSNEASAVYDNSLLSITIHDQ